MNEMTRTLVVAGIVLLAMVLGGGMVYVITLASGHANRNVAVNDNPQVAAPVKTIPPAGQSQGPGRPGANGGRRGGGTPQAQPALPVDPALTDRLTQLDKWVAAKNQQSTQQALDDLRKWSQQSPRQVASILSDNWTAKNIISRLVRDNKAYQQVIDLIDSTTAALEASDTGGAIIGSIGLGTFDTQAEYRDIHVQDDNGKDLYFSNFSANSDGWKAEAGTWNAVSGIYRPTAQGTSLTYLRDENWSNYTVSLQARKIGGKEGFLIVFGHKGHEKFWWNLGGWSNAYYGFELNGMEDQSTVGPRVPGTIETNRWYDIKLQVHGSQISGYLDGKLVQQVNATPAVLNDQFVKGMRHWKAICLIETGQADKAADLIKQNFAEGWDDTAKVLADIVTPLANKKQYSPVLKVTESVLLTSPEVTATVESVLNQRITALVAMQDHEQALAEAKRLFNYASMEKTSDALRVLDRELQVVNKARVDLFHKEEEEGAVAPANGQVVKSTVLAAIHVNGMTFQAQAQLVTGQDYAALIKHGALWLLADDADKAVEAFNTALAAAKNASEKQAASTWVARAMKAQDGTIGRANEWVTNRKSGD